jgi:phosphoenolpyruvate synthase/pyruvate phosphate dikinase
MSQPLFYSFADDNKACVAIEKDKLKTVLGTKGANLCELTSAGVPVPKGFVITNELSVSYYAADPAAFPENFSSRLKEGVEKLEGEAQKKFRRAEQSFFSQFVIHQKLRTRKILYHFSTWVSIQNQLLV